MGTAQDSEAPWLKHLERRELVPPTVVPGPGPRLRATAATATAAASRVGVGSGLQCACNAARDLQQAGLAAGPDSLAFWAMHYLAERTVGRSKHTFEAKARDLAAFALWFVESRRQTDLRAWRVDDTFAYLDHLRGKGRAPKTINRALGTLKHFARWAQDKHAVFGAQGLPTADVSELPEEEPPCRRFSDDEVGRLFAAGRGLVRAQDKECAAAQRAGRPPPRPRGRPRRDLAMMAVLLHTGLRAQELVVLRLAQYDGEALYRVARKGHNETRRLYVPMGCRELLADYLAHERQRDDPTGHAVPLFLATRSGGYLARQHLTLALKRIGDAAGVAVHPHKFRHTFGARYRAVSGSDTETAAALAHQSLNYVGRYVRASDEECDAMRERVASL